MVKSIGKGAWAVLAAALGVFSWGCSSENPAASGATEGDVPGDFGGLNLHLTVPVGFHVASIDYNIVDTVTGLTVKSATTDVGSDRATASAFLLLPPGNYVANLAAAGTQPCTGSSTGFSIVANSNISVPVALICGTGSSPAAGGVVVDAGFTVADRCGFTEMFVGPLTQGLGHDITTTADAQAYSPTASYAWTSSVAIGTFGNPSSAFTVFRCSAIGTTTLTVTLIDGTCTDREMIDVTCVDDIICGNGVVQPGEQCDDGNVTSNDGCSASCVLEVCGDNIVQSIEQCDDGNVTSNDGCSASCVLEVCGDNIVQSIEQCDDGNRTPGDGCDAGCQREPVCGNGSVEAPETCDDGNVTSNDGCSASCVLEVCGDGAVQGAEECDDGNRVAGDGCDGSCFVEIACGIVDLFVAPLQQGIGKNITLSVTVQASPRASFLWTSSAPIGSFGNATQRATVFTCTAAGNTGLTFTLTDGVCSSSVWIPVTCASGI